jgi:hypothetical protein
MVAPFIFIATNRLKPGKLEDERRRVPALSAFIEENEPRLIGFHEYVNEDGTEVGVVQIHPDAASMEFHMDVIRERAERAYAETLEATTSIQVFGTPSDQIDRTTWAASRDLRRDEKRRCGGRRRRAVSRKRISARQLPRVTTPTKPSDPDCRD